MFSSALGHGIEILTGETENVEADMGKIRAICISEKRGTQKRSIPEAEFIEDWGIKGDAHAGKWHRQVSLLSYDKIQAFRSREKRRE